MLLTYIYSYRHSYICIIFPRERLNVREDGAGEVIVGDLVEMVAEDCEALSHIIDTGINQYKLY